jgi:hypothetical protein
MTNLGKQYNRQQEENGISDFKFHVSQNKKLEIFKGNGELVNDVNDRILAFKMFLEGWKLEQLDFTSGTEQMATMLHEVKAAFVPMNNSQKLIVGESRDKLGNIYVFHSDTTGQPFYMPPKHFGDMTWADGESYQPKIRCEFGKGSKQVTLMSIKNPRLDDGGLRRLTPEDGHKFNELPLEVKAMLGFRENRWFQLASVSRNDYNNNGCFQHSDGRQVYRSSFDDALLLLGCSPSRRKPA